MRLMLCVVLTCLVLLPHRCYASLVDYVGCLVPTEMQDTIIEKEVDDMFERTIPFSHRIEESTSMTIQTCVQQCWLHKYEFAALQRGEECYCEHWSKDLSAVTDQFCRIRCRGNSLQRCGGKLAFSVYQTGYEKGPSALRTHYNLAIGYLGCFDEIRRPPVHQPLHYETNIRPIQPLVSSRMTAQLCAAYCLSGNHAVAVLEEINKCCCRPYREEWIRGPGRVDDHLCNLPCLGSAATTTTTTNPNCVGRINSDRYVTAYDTLALSMNGGLPKLPISTFNPLGGWLNIHFPADNDFEERSHQDGYALTKALMAEGAHRHIIPIKGPVFDPDNTRFSVIDVIGEEPSDANVSRIVLLVFAIIGLSGIIAAGFLLLTERYWQEKSRSLNGPARRYVRCAYGVGGSPPSPQGSPLRHPKESHLYRPQPDPYSYNYSWESWRTKNYSPHQQRRAFR